MDRLRFFLIDPKSRRWFLFAILGVAMLVVAVLVPIVLASSYYKRTENSGIPFTINTADPKFTPTISPLPSVQAASLPEATRAVATPLRDNCTHTAVYWLYHQEVWPALISVGDLNYTKEEAISRLQADTQGARGNLFLQLHAALLNVLSGAEPGGIKETILQAIQWWSTHPENLTLSQPDLDQARALTGILEEFNNGIRGPGLCAGQPGVEVPGRITTSFPTQVIILETATLTSTGVPSPTATHFYIARTPTRAVASPTRPPGSTPAPSATPTRYHPPPSRTPTQVVPPTPTATQVPPPTATEAPLPPTPRPTPTSPPEPFG